MVRFAKFGLAVVCALCVATTTRAGLRLPAIVGDGMVLQQRSEARLWGWADPGAEIGVTTSWNGRTVRAEADATGLWELTVETPEASAVPYDIAVSDGRTTLTLGDVLVGEVWFCSGQSNMEMPLAGFRHQPVAESGDAIARAGCYPAIRMATVPRAMASEPRQEAGGGWERSSSAAAGRFSATAYFFARRVHEVLGVPVGIIHCSWGGSKAEGWMPREIVAEYEDIDLRDTTSRECADYLRPTVMYNAMLYPLHRYTMRGFLWYQGCSNVGAHATYAARQAAMVAHWRGLWGAELPFYFVEIAPYRYGDDDAGAYLREAQHRAAELIPRSGIVSTADLVEPWEADHIHPERKREVGERLAALALNKTYGLNGIACESPRYRAMTLEADGAAVLSFDHAESGFASRGRWAGRTRVSKRRAPTGCSARRRPCCWTTKAGSGWRCPTARRWRRCATDSTTGRRPSCGAGADCPCCRSGRTNGDGCYESRIFGYYNIILTAAGCLSL